MPSAFFTHLILVNGACTSLCSSVMLPSFHGLNKTVSLRGVNVGGEIAEGIVAISDYREAVKMVRMVL